MSTEVSVECRWSNNLVLIEGIDQGYQIDTQLWMPLEHMIQILLYIHQTHCEKSDWSRAFNQFTIACELDMINAISATDIAFIMSSSTSAWLLHCKPLGVFSSESEWLNALLLFLRMNYMCKCIR